MGKALYAGISSKARKAKRLYVGVSGKARKIKKMYIGVGGKARYYLGTTTVGSYALFGGGESDLTSSADARDSVEAYNA